MGLFISIFSFSSLIFFEFTTCEINSIILSLIPIFSLAEVSKYLILYLSASFLASVEETSLGKSTLFPIRIIFMFLSVLSYTLSIHSVTLLKVLLLVTSKTIITPSEFL